ncbi:uncharacterized protein TrAtP1_011157 [Trichoderma atroviride]|uniref:uncharacterized protein n=1 Tax=Hypocrea atroviridis TaxID=63577 RepID=UPI003316EB0C|nr:hypothetical protein TrAtP1_011157 [Trichoderma atroviride]
MIYGLASCLSSFIFRSLRNFNSQSYPSSHVARLSHFEGVLKQLAHFGGENIKSHHLTQLILHPPRHQPLNSIIQHSKIHQSFLSERKSKEGYEPMMTATAYPVTMSDLRGEPAHSNFWSTYNGSAHLANRLGTATMDSGFHSSASASPLPGRPRSGHDQSYPYGRYPQEDSVAYERHSQSSLSAQHSYPSLKRPFSQTEPAAYQEIVQDLRDDGSRLTVNQDHKLLAFRRTQDKHTIVDQQGRMQQLELSAQLHGMFFLSEMPATASDGTALQPELTCYRRNLFQISGSLITPRGQLSVVNESNETLLVTSMEVAITAIESVDGNPVRLIVIPWKTPHPMPLILIKARIKNLPPSL